MVIGVANLRSRSLLRKSVLFWPWTMPAKLQVLALDEHARVQQHVQQKPRLTLGEAERRDGFHPLGIGQVDRPAVGFRRQHHRIRWTIRLLSPRRVWKARLVYQHAAREHLGGRLEPANVQVLEWLFPERKRLAEPGAAPANERYVIASKNFNAPRFRALYRQWLEDPANTLWMAGSNTIADAVERVSL